MGDQQVGTEDLYQVLGIAADAPTEQVKRAYRKLARTLHPDVNPDPAAHHQFARVAQAHTVLCDPARRAEYDQQRLAASAGGVVVSAAGASAGSHAGAEAGPVHSPFAHTSSGPLARGVDLYAQTTLSLWEAASGTTCQLLVKYAGTCPTCAGTGDSPSGGRHTCLVCDGLGMKVQTGEACPPCHGVGSRSDYPCPTCEGSGRQEHQAHQTVAVPAGVSDGQRLRLARQGAPGSGGGPPGDLYLNVSVREHPLFQRVPDSPYDIGLVVPVTYSELVLGATLTLPTVDGAVTTLTLPAASRPNVMHHLDGCGLPDPEGNRGSMRVWVTLAFGPTPASAERTALLALQEAERAAWDPRDGMFAAAKQH